MADLLASLASLEDDFLASIREGSRHVSVFNDRITELAALIEDAARSNNLPQHVRESAYSTFAAILSHAEVLAEHEEDADEIISHIIPDDGAGPGASAASLPLFRYLLDNICLPYPDQDEKDRLVEEARAAGWADFDKKKCEDWLNRKRHQSGYVAIARKYCDEDNDAMRSLCYAALFGSPEQKTRLHPQALEEIEAMHELLQSQYEELDAKETSPWVDNLTHVLRDVVGAPCTEPLSSDVLSSDNEEVDFADCSSDESDSDSDASASDDGSDLDEDETTVKEVADSPLPAVIGSKRKVSDPAPFRSSRSRRTPSSSSSSSSSSAFTSSVVSLRSFSGCSVSSATSWEEDECERPAKRTRSESFSPAPEASCTSHSRIAVDLWAMRVPSNPVAQSKRKREDDDLETLARNMKRSRYAALSAAAPCHIPAHDLVSFTDVCTRSWSSVVPFEVLSFSVDSELYTVDCTAIQASAAADEDDEDEDNDLADIIDLCNDPDAPDDATWATVQLHALAQTLTGSRLPMPAELCADTVEVKLEELSPQELSSLGETLATTAESITAEYPLDQSLLLEDDDAFSPPELSDGESSGSSSPDRSPSPPVELESSPERLIADYAMSTRTRKELDTLQHPWFAQMFGQQGLSFFDPNTFRVECNPPPGMMAQESHPDFLAQLDL